MRRDRPDFDTEVIHFGKTTDHVLRRCAGNHGDTLLVEVVDGGDR